MTFSETFQVEMRRFSSGQFNLLLTAFAGSSVSESLGEGIVIDLQLSDLLILIGRHRDELGLLEHVGPEGGVRQLQDVVGPHQVEPRLVLVHGVEDGLERSWLVFMMIIIKF